MATKNPPRAGDVTGRIKAQKEAEFAAQKSERAAELAMVTKALETEKDEVLDLQPSVFEEAQPVLATPEVEALEDDEVEVHDRIVTFRVTEDLEQVTIGAGHNYDFKQGQRYRAPWEIYKHLDSKGLVWH